MTVDELIDRLKELPGYRPVVVVDEFGAADVDGVEDTGWNVVLRAAL